MQCWYSAQVGVQVECFSSWLNASGNAAVCRGWLVRLLQQPDDHAEIMRLDQSLVEALSNHDVNFLAHPQLLKLPVSHLLPAAVPNGISQASSACSKTPTNKHTSRIPAQCKLLPCIWVCTS
jgi:hypothetical protein